jgi:hypothetical protein
MMQRMKGWLICAALIASPSFGTDASTYPTQEFLTLPQPQRNLAVYDAFWGSLESYYYDPELLTAKKWRTLRQDMRARAAREPDEFELYKRCSAKSPRSFRTRTSPRSCRRASRMHRSKCAACPRSGCARW